VYRRVWRYMPDESSGIIGALTSKNELVCLFSDGALVGVCREETSFVVVDASEGGGEFGTEATV
jgi:hypothetical protein